MGPRLRDDRGAEAVELALISIPLIAIIAGIVEFGFAYQAQVTVSQAARAGARLAAICGATCPTPVITSTKDAAPGLSGPIVVGVVYCPAGQKPQDCVPDPTKPPGPSYCPTGSTQATGSAVVTVSYVDTFSFAVLPKFAKPKFTLTGEASLPCGG